MKVLLYPLSVLYNLITAFRNLLYRLNIGAFKENTFDVFTISVGNLAVGGTGKTPHVAFLVNKLYQNYKVATLSRGYGRATKGMIIADNNTKVSQIGDEPMQYYFDFYPKIHVVVAEQRSVAIPALLSKHPETQIVLLDDAYQHRKVKPDLNLLISEYQKPFFKDYLMPMGRLRESRYGARRADAVIISKCPDDIDYKMEYYRRKMRKYLKNKDIPVFFTGLKYGNPIDILNPYVQFNETDHILLVTGIANASILKKYLKSNFKLAKHLVFKDHHNYTIEDFAYIYKTYKGINSGNKCIITTQKDMMKWKESDFSRHLSNIPVFYIPIEVYFIEKEKEFMDLVFDKMKQKQDTLRKLHNNEEN